MATPTDVAGRLPFVLTLHNYNVGCSDAMGLRVRAAADREHRAARQEGGDAVSDPRHELRSEGGDTECEAELWTAVT